ncbi:MAG: recombinase family protein [Chthoniobacterales bacterium]|nr:recombinase family protein [Chthoniobacterales bacterium]
MSALLPEPKTAYAYIRFSSGKQATGDSYQRQLERAQDFANKHNLLLDESTTLEDLGVSGYLGKNLETGPLPGFVEAVKNNRVSAFIAGVSARHVIANSLRLRKRRLG